MDDLLVFDHRLQASAEPDFNCKTPSLSRHDGKALEKTEQVEQVMHRYYSRLDLFPAKMGEDLHQTTVSVVRITPLNLVLYLKDIFVENMAIGFRGLKWLNKEAL